MDQTNKPPFARRLAASCLTIMHAVLPKSLYDRVYFFLFPRYKARLRRQYRDRALRKPNADPEKIATVFKCLEFSLVGSEGMEATYDCTRRVIRENVAGDLVECGVAQGGSALLIALVNAKFGGSRRQLWLFDSYEGLPDPTSEDYKDGKTGTHIRPLPKGSCLGTIGDVSRLLFEQHNIPRNSTHLVKGWFQDTLPVTRDKLGAIALLRLDGDWYESTKVCFENLYDKVSPGGFVILDDYFSCYGCKRATDEFLAARGTPFPIIPDGRGGAFFQKL
ncbi:MAG: class I SAM-dependent methyltransferase [Opitutaceae bacterium]|nr:class I SAM-dependent methyltransferase [Opitutaceae bacterium]